MPAVQFGKLTGDRQPQPQTAVFTREPAVTLPEPIEDMRQERGVDAASRVR